MTRTSPSGDAICPPPLEARQAEPAALEPQTFADESDRARLSEVALKAFLALIKAWELIERGGLRSLGVSASTLDRIKRGYRPTLSQDQLTRSRRWLASTKGFIFCSPTRRRTNWARRPNSGPLFDRETPIEAMIEGGIPRMLDVRRYIDAARGGL